MNEKYIEELDMFCENADLSALCNKAIMVTGASGLIGSYLVDVFMRFNEVQNNCTKVYAIVRNGERALERFKEYIENPLFHLVEHDVSSPAAFDFPVDYIIHAASNANPKAFDEDPIGTIQANVTGTLYLLGYARKCGALKLLYISSSEVYGEPFNTGTIYDENSMGAVDPMKPRACYTESKRMAENICVNYAKQYGVSSCIARVCFAYGPTFKGSDNRVIPQLLRKALNGQNIVLKSTGNLVRSYAYLYDVASGLFKILLKGKTGEAYNIANHNSNVSIREIAETIAEVTGVKLLFDLPKEDQDKGYAPFSMALLDAGKLEALGWKPSFDMKTGLKQTIDIWCSENIGKMPE